MRRRGRRADAVHYRHEDTGTARDYPLGDSMYGRETLTLCGHWFSSCDDDPINRRPVWRWDAPAGEPLVTCPHCLAIIADEEST